MAGIAAMGTTFNLPNYVGELFAVTPEDTPFLSAIGGLTGGGSTTATEFEWQTYDLGDPGQHTVVEGAAAPTAEARVRANVRNVLQIQQKKISISYTKQAATGQLATPGSAPFRGVPGENPVGDEMSWQTVQALKEMALDVNWSYLNGTYANPTDNTTPRQTRGLLQAIVTNRIAKGTSVTGVTSATDTITSTAHGLSNGQAIVFTATGAATGIIAGRTYYLSNVATNTFKVGKSAAGAAITLGTATGLAYTVPQSSALAVADIEDLLQLAYDNGGISEQATATIVVNSRQKRAITAAYATAYGQSVLINQNNRTMGGVAVDTVMTNFGTLGIMMDRHMPQDTLLVASMEQLMPVFMNIPGKGVLFSEPLAKVGASDEEQLYGEIGLKYGNEMAHAAMTGLK